MCIYMHIAICSTYVGILTYICTYIYIYIYIYIWYIYLVYLSLYIYLDLDLDISVQLRQGLTTYTHLRRMLAGHRTDLDTCTEG